ncbi:hypothetical protein CsSME_00012675 [Camellia sinensis var. sinensis]
MHFQSLKTIFLTLSKKLCIMQKVSNGKRLWMKRSGHFTRTRLGSWCNFQKKEGIPGRDNIRFKARLVFSPVVKHTSIRILLALGAQFDLELAQLDVKTAFLHGDLEEEIYMSQPDGFKIAGKENWACKLNKSLYGLKQSPRQWYKRFDRFMMETEYTRNDMLIASTSKVEIDKLKAQLAREFDMKDLGEAKKVLGMEIKRDRKKGTVLKWILRYIHGTVNLGLKFERDNRLGQNLEGYVDSDYAGDLDKRRSTTGYLFTLAKGPAEYMAVTEAFKEAIWLHGLIEDLGIVQKHVKVFCDSQSAICLAKNQVHHARTKHIDVRFHFIREIVNEGDILLQKIGTADNPADMLTKVVSGIKFQHCLDLVNISWN